MRTYYDENFGFWHDTEDPDVQEFYEEVQRRSKETECRGCGRLVSLLPGYAYCNSCADARERGVDL